MIINDLVIRLAQTLYPVADAMDQALDAIPEGDALDKATAAMIGFQRAYHTLIEDLVEEVAKLREETGAIPEMPSDAETAAILSHLEDETVTVQ